MLIVSSGAHSILGWRGIRAELAAARVPADLMLGLQLGWHFGGAAMLTMGVVLLVIYRQRLRGVAASLRAGPGGIDDVSRSSARGPSGQRAATSSRWSS